MYMNATQFLNLLNNSLWPLVDKERTLIASYSSGFSPGPGRGSITINFINLPHARHKERRGGGAESENNRQLFMVWGFNENPESPVEKIKLEQSSNGIGYQGLWAPKLRSKTGSPDKVATMLIRLTTTIETIGEKEHEKEQEAQRHTEG
jgi:hypothetical protein